MNMQVRPQGTFILGAVLLGRLVACASQTAQPAIDLANLTVSDSSSDRARKCAPELQAMAERTLAEAKDLEKRGKFDEASSKARQAEELAKRARAASPVGCDEMVAEEERTSEPELSLPDGQAAATLTALRAALEPVYFEYNLAIIQPASREQLSEVARLLQTIPDQMLEIEGHCDNRGSTEFNLHLGEKRARSVLKYLVAQGVPPEQLSYISYGEEQLARYGNTEADHALNRRAVLNLRSQ